MCDKYLNFRFVYNFHSELEMDISCHCKMSINTESSFKVYYKKIDW